jgi:hypothetical protein
VQRDRSGAIELIPAYAVGTSYSRIVPTASSEIDTSRFALGSVNHRVPSCACAIDLAPVGATEVGNCCWESGRGFVGPPASVI